MSVKKKSRDQTGATGRSVRASGYATKARPGPWSTMWDTSLPR